MISFPVVPAAPAPLAGAGAPPAATDNSNFSDAAEFLDLLKALTAPGAAPVAAAPLAAKLAGNVGNAGAPLPLTDAALAVSAPVAQRPAPAHAQAPDEAPRPERPESVDGQNVDPAAMLPIVAPVAVAPVAVAPPPAPNALPDAGLQTPAPVDQKLVAALANRPANLPSGSEAAPTNSAASAAPAAPAEQPAAPESAAAPDIKAQVPVAAAPAARAKASVPADIPAQSPVDKSPSDKAPSDKALADASPVATAPASGAEKSSANSRTPGAATAPVAAASAAVQNAPADAGTSKRDSHANASDRRNLDAVAPRAASAPSTAPVFQMNADIRSLLATGSGPVTISSPALQSISGRTLGVRDASDIPQQIVSAMRLQWNNGVGDARIRLTPEYLGDVTISIRVERGEVTAMLQASAPETRQWIESHESMLRQMLSDRGLHLDEFVVSEDRPASSSDEGGGEDRETRERQQPARRKATPGATFEVVA